MIEDPKSGAGADAFITLRDFLPELFNFTLQYLVFTHLVFQKSRRDFRLLTQAPACKQPSSSKTVRHTSTVNKKKGIDFFFMPTLRIDYVSNHSIA